MKMRPEYSLHSITFIILGVFANDCDEFKMFPVAKLFFSSLYQVKYLLNLYTKIIHNVA